MTPRVLHVVESLDRGAVENWLLRMLTHACARKLAMDWTFYCQLPQPGSQDQKAFAAGANVIHSPVPVSRKQAFASELRKEIRRGGYDVLHCHHDLVSGLYLAAAAGLPIRRRIVHVHNADENVLTSSKLKQALYREPLRRICLAASDVVAGISNHTLDTFLAGHSRRPGRDVVHYYGVDPAPFENAVEDRGSFRRQLGLPDDALVLLFAGRMVPEKNPLFVVDVIAALRQIESRAVAVFAGTGGLEPAVLARAAELGVGDAVRLIGWRSDLAAVMVNCDWFSLPRPELPMEGFGLAVVEAQLAGLRLLLSRGIPDDPLLPGAIFRRLPLAAGPSAWADAAFELLHRGCPSRPAAREALRHSPMDMDHALSSLTALHGVNVRVPAGSCRPTDFPAG